MAPRNNITGRKIMGPNSGLSPDSREDFTEAAARVRRIRLCHEALALMCEHGLRMHRGRRHRKQQEGTIL